MTTSAPSCWEPQLAQMECYLTPFAASLELLWGAMPDAFRLAFGREVDKGNAYEITLCYAVICRFPVGQVGGPEDVLIVE